MAKAKKSGSKKKKSDGVKKGKVTAAKPRALNPFEVHVNRQKFEVLGRKLKNDRGLPGVSRAKALKKVFTPSLKENLNDIKMVFYSRGKQPFCRSTGFTTR